MSILSYEAVAGDGWYSIAKKLGGSQASQAVKDQNANYLAAANGRKDISTGTLFPGEILWYNPDKLVMQPVGPVLTLGFPVYGAAQRASWKTTSPKYAALLGSWAGKPDRVDQYVVNYIPNHDTPEMERMISASVYIKCQAVLYATNKTQAHKDAVWGFLDKFAGITTRTQTFTDNTRVDLAWITTNICQAAALTGYPKLRIEDFLRFVYKYLDWWAGGNWHASEADSRLAVASYLEDMVMWADAKAFYYWHLPRANWMPVDGDSVKGIPGTQLWPGKATLPANAAATSFQWNLQTSETSLKVPAFFKGGNNAEDARDLSHVGGLGTGGWVNATNTILAAGDTLEPGTLERLRTHVDRHATRCLYYLTTGKLPIDPTPSQGNGVGGTGLLQAWTKTQRLFGANTPQSVLDMLKRSDVTGYAPGGVLHNAAELFADAA
jgi:hypothetical protein